MQKSGKEKSERAVCRVTFLPGAVGTSVERGTSIYDAALKAGVQINSVCGGRKQCGKCKVIVRRGSVTGGGASLLDAADVRAGLVLACDTYVDGDVVVEVPPESVLGAGRILEGEKASETLPRRFPLDPLVKKIYVEPEPPSVENNIDDVT
ncbi:MAG: hypothetical protein DRP79_05805, partial [Planctomycetota bacterium]